MSHFQIGQDWKPVTIGGGSGGGRGGGRGAGGGRAAGGPVEKKFNAGTNHSVADTRKFEEEEDAFTVKKVSLDLRVNIQRARTLKGWSQADLARHISEQQRVVADWEAGKAQPNQQVLQKMERALGMYLKGAKAMEPLPQPKPKGKKAAA
eukprot:TRINITY_DN4417_c0_g1_i1.p3 TRINITY_DN4417_c0_g1~~TRINITY_DN4417_c0_g1_i1.p3  ORF type:complete len:170 (+),score=31.25 TRINITY_DN4417_c0_g1_i1:63-512(+)